MGTPSDYLPGPVSDDAINQLLLSIGLPKATEIVAPKVTAQYHSIHLIVVPKNPRTVHTRLVLRVSGKHLPTIKTENEMAVMTWIKRNTSVPVPDIVAYDSSDANKLGHEYSLLSLVSGTTLSDIYASLTETQMLLILGQLADYLSQLHEQRWNAIGGLRMDKNGAIVVDRIVDETFWQAPDVDKLWPGETVDSVNLGGPYPTYIDLISAQIKTYIHLIQAHKSLAPMQDAVPRLEAFVQALPAHAEELNRVQLRLAHKDLHFANILYDVESDRVTSILDWEFSGVVPFTKWNPRRSFLWNGKEGEDSVPEKSRLLDIFQGICKKRNLTILEDAEYASPL
ncbi:kinase-like protein [Byssothecium circinans]|uniref:Kinase-like protein n=1 Tax=Byssothecium circinans TaxID=147558 RepID=A0A6A5TQH5_9PLEO|nr:kinase-like protein [Byssothecium circinans]